MRWMIALTAFVILTGCATTPGNDGAKTGTGEEMIDLPNFDAMWDFNDPSGTEAKFNEVLTRAEAAENDAYTASLLTQIARTQGLQRKFDQAMKTLDRSKILMTSDMTVPRIRYLLELGRVYHSWGKTSESIPVFNEAYNIATEHQKDALAVDAAHMLGIVLPIDQQLEWHLKSLEIVENTDVQSLKGWLGPLYNNIGWTYHDMGKFEKALMYFKRDVVYREQIGDVNGLAISKWSVARTYRSLNRIDDALDILTALKAEAEAQNNQPSGFVYEELGECLLLQGESEKAQPFFKEAYQILSRDQWMVENESERLKRLKILGSSD